MATPTLFDEELEASNPEPVRPAGQAALAFVVFGHPEQRGSKVAVPRGKRGGGIQRRKNGSIVIDMKDSNKDSAAYMKYAAAIAGQAFYAAGYNKLFTEPIELGARFYFKRPMAHYGTGANAGKLKKSAPTIHAQSPDLAKLLRCIEDALTGVVWLDDKLVFKYTHDTARYWTEGQERTEVFIYRHPQG